MADLKKICVEDVCKTIPTGGGSCEPYILDVDYELDTDSECYTYTIQAKALDILSHRTDRILLRSVIGTKERLVEVIGLKYATIPNKKNSDAKVSEPYLELYAYSFDIEGSIDTFYASNADDYPTLLSCPK